MQYKQKRTENINMLFNNIPDYIRCLIPCNAQEFDAIPGDLQQMIYNQAKQEYERWHKGRLPKQSAEILDFSDWGYEAKDYRRDFLYYNYKEHILSLSGTPRDICEENLLQFISIVESWMLDGHPGHTWTAYQISVVTSKGYINAKPADLLYAIYNKMQEYNDDVLTVGAASIRYNTGEDRTVIASQLYAGAGEGIPINIGEGFWLLDLVQSKKLCIINCYVLWLYYKNRALQEYFLPGGTKEFLSHRDKIYEKVGRNKKGVSIKDVYNVAPHEYRIIFSLEELSTIKPKETMDKCLYFYHNGHIYLITHENYMKGYIDRVEMRSKQTTVTKIATKKIPDCTNIDDLQVMDIESFRQEISDSDHAHTHIPLMCGHMNKDVYKCFKGEDCLTRYLKWVDEKLPDKSVIWAHNGGKYDYHVIFKAAIEACDVKLDKPIEILDINGKYIQLVIHFSSGKTVYFRDSCALMSGSLNSLAEGFGVAGKLPEIDIKNVTREELLHSHKILAYNEQDCKVLMDVLTIYRKQAIEAFGLDPLNHPSSSSYGKRVFFAKYYDEKKFPLYSLSRAVHNYIYESYGGGRCEVFNRGAYRGKLHHMDINSAYPFAATLPLPYDKYKWHDKLELVDDVKAFLDKYPGFYRTYVVSSDNVQPIHGVKHGGKYVFPKFDNLSNPITLFSEEIKYGLTHGYKYKLIDGHECKLGTWAGDYFKYMYSNRQKAKKAGNAGLEYSYKITSNSSYGFFGFQKYNRSVTHVYGKHMKEHATALEFSANANFHEYDNVLISQEMRDVLLDDVNVGVAAAITSYGRIHLHRIITLIEKYGGKVYYCDTDCVITDLDMVTIPECAAELGEKLGQLKYELKDKAHIENLVIVGCKLYGYNTSAGKTIAHVKGVYSNGKDQENQKFLYESLIQMLDKPMSFDVNTMVTSRINKTKGDLNVYDQVIHKELLGVYTKRHIINETGETVPLLY